MTSAMEGNLDYIDNYFAGALSGEEMTEFSRKVETDPAFAHEVSFYLSMFRAVKDEGKQERKARFQQIYAQSLAGRRRPGTSVRRIWQFAAAAAVLALAVLSVMYLLPGSGRDPGSLADAYITKKFATLGVTMGTATDTLEKGKALYNEKKFAESLQLFETLLRSDSSDFEALKFAGIVCLRQGNYEKALWYFTRLQHVPGLYANPGKFYRALVLLKRNKAGDKKMAKQILEQVSNEDLEGKEEAEKWLKSW